MFLNILSRYKLSAKLRAIAKIWSQGGSANSGAMAEFFTNRCYTPIIVKIACISTSSSIGLEICC